MNNDPSKQEIAMEHARDIWKVQKVILPIQIYATSNADDLTLLLESQSGMQESMLFKIPNSHLATIANHLLGLLEKPAKASGLKVKATGPSEHFSAFWSLYPTERKVAKHQMLDKWRAHNLDREWDAIRSHLKMNLPIWAKDKGFKFCPMVTTYINQRRWEAMAEDRQPEIPIV